MITILPSQPGAYLAHNKIIVVLGEDRVWRLQGARQDLCARIDSDLSAYLPLVPLFELAQVTIPEATVSPEGITKIFIPSTEMVYVEL